MCRNTVKYTHRAIHFDKETELYYLSTRYYSPNLGRFLNADALTSTGQGILGNNMFSYCQNNPVMFSDPNGQCREVGALLTWFDCGDPNCSTSSVNNPSRYYAGYNHPKTNTYLDSEPSCKSLIREQDTPLYYYYRGVLVITIPGSSSFSCGFILMGRDGTPNLLNHEYGHIVQREKLGRRAYRKYVLKPSLNRYWKTVFGIYSWDTYYSTPWEFQADQYGDAVHPYKSWAADSSERYWERVYTICGIN